MGSKCTCNTHHNPQKISEFLKKCVYTAEIDKIIINTSSKIFEVLTDSHLFIIDGHRLKIKGKCK